MYENNCPSQREITLQKHVAELESKVYEMKIKVCDYDRVAAKCAQQQEELNKLNCFLNSVVQKQETCFNEFVEEYELMWTKNKTLECRNEELRDENHKIKSKMQNLSESLKCLDMKIRDMSDANKELECENGQLKEDVCRCKESLENVQNCLKNKERKLEVVNKAVHAISCKLKGFEKDKKFGQPGNEDAELACDAAKIQQELRAEIKHLQNEIEIKCSTMAELKNKLKEKQCQLDNKSAALCDAKRAQDELRVKYESELNELTKTLDCMKSRNELLVHENRSISQRLSNIQMQYKQTKAQFREQTNCMHEMKARIEDLENGLSKTTSCPNERPTDQNRHSDTSNKYKENQEYFIQRMHELKRSLDQREMYTSKDKSDCDKKLCSKTSRTRI